MNDSAERLARAFVAAIIRQNVDTLATLMTPDHRFIDPLGNMVEGREKMRAGWAGYFKMVPDYRITVEECICDRQTVVLFGVAFGTYAPNVQLKP